MKIGKNPSIKFHPFKYVNENLPVLWKEGSVKLYIFIKVLQHKLKICD